jgi:sensor histidine kinase regulating citrate/malate metabolism
MESLRASFVGMAYTILIFAFLSSLALLYALTLLARHEVLEREHQVMELREIYYEGLKREQNQVHTLRHDLRNHLSVLQGLLERGEEEKAQDYLQELAQSPALCGVKRLCENEVANVVLSCKLEIMQRKGMTADFAVFLPAQTGISDIDLCSLLGNALDNAIEGAEQAEDKRITLRIRTDKGMLMLRLNNALGAETLENDQFVTTKPDKRKHGFGLPGMREIAQHYGGYLEANAHNGSFELVVCLPYVKVNES